MAKELSQAEHIAQIRAEQELNHKTKAALKAGSWRYLQYRGPSTAILMRCQHEHQNTMTPLDALANGCPTCNEMKVAIPVDKKAFLRDLREQNDALYRGYKKTQRPNARSNAPCDRYTI